MNLGEVKQLLHDAAVKYHPGATVVWEKTGGVTPLPPYITLGYRNLSRTQFPMYDEGQEHRFYAYSFRFEVNIYTAGKPAKDRSGRVIYHENTAVEDMEEFVRFLDSEEMTDELAESGVAVTFEPPIRDLSELAGGAKFHYRSMAEFTVTFSGLSDGRYGVSGSASVPNPSGGGALHMANAGTDAIEEIEITEVTKKGR